MVIVLTSLFSILIPDANSFSTLKVIRMVRMLRPLRVVSKNDGLRVSI